MICVFVFVFHICMIFVLVFDICMIFVFVFDICMIFVLVFDHMYDICICIWHMYDICMTRPLTPAGATTIDNWPLNKFLARNLLSDQRRCPSSSFFPDHNPISNHQPTPSSTLLFRHFWSPASHNLISDRHYSVILSASLKSVHSFQWVPCGCDDWGVVWLLRLWTGFSELSKYSLTL